jgi:hypothetical protein
VPAVRAGVCAIKEVVKARVTNETISPVAIAARCTPLITEYSIKAYGATGHVELLKSRSWVYTIGGAGNGITRSFVSLARGSNETVSDHMASIAWTTFRVYLHSLPGSYSDANYNYKKFTAEATGRTLADAGGGEWVKGLISSAFKVAATSLSFDAPVSINPEPLHLNLSEQGVCKVDQIAQSWLAVAHPTCPIEDNSMPGVDRTLPEAIDSL